MWRRPLIASPRGREARAVARSGRSGRSRRRGRRSRRGLRAWTSSGPRPHFSIVPGRKFSSTMSAVARELGGDLAGPRGSRRLSATERLLRARIDHHRRAVVVAQAAPVAHRVAGRRGASTLITSAPKSPSSVPVNGPASSCPNSIARRPVSGVVVGHVSSRNAIGAEDVHPHHGLGQLRRRGRGTPRRAGGGRSATPSRCASSCQNAVRNAARDAGRGAHRDREPRAAAPPRAMIRWNCLVGVDLVLDAARSRRRRRASPSRAAARLIAACAAQRARRRGSSSARTS